MLSQLCVPKVKNESPLSNICFFTLAPTFITQGTEYQVMNKAVLWEKSIKRTWGGAHFCCCAKGSWVIRSKTAACRNVIMTQWWATSWGLHFSLDLLLISNNVWSSREHMMVHCVLTGLYFFLKIKCSEDLHSVVPLKMSWKAQEHYLCWKLPKHSLASLSLATV